MAEAIPPVGNHRSRKLPFSTPNKILCDAAQFNEQPILMTLVMTYFVIGVYYISLGYRGFKTTHFLTGFTCGVGIVYALCTQEQVFPLYGNIMIALCAGVLFGFITMLIQYVGLFVTGLHNGLLLAIFGMILSATAPFIHPTSGWVSFFILLFTGVVFACLNLYWKKGLTIISTSQYGATLIATSLDFFIDKGLTVQWGIARVKQEPDALLPCPYSGISLATWAICTILGIILQWNLTGTGICHEESLAAQKRRLKLPPYLTREQRAEMRQRKYRYLYQVRTAHGDVISQSYVQALQQKSSNTDPWSAGGAGECSTLQSDSTHLTALGPDIPQPDSDEDVNQIRVCH